MLTHLPVTPADSRARTHWCVLTIAVRLIFPSWIAFFKTGATLRSKVNTQTQLADSRDLLLGIRRVDDHGILRLVIHYKIRVVVTTPHPWQVTQLDKYVSLQTS
jgi:hypothetical protein